MISNFVAVERGNPVFYCTLCVCRTRITSLLRKTWEVYKSDLTDLGEPSVENGSKHHTKPDRIITDMVNINSEYPDQEILERAAEAEKSQHPYHYEVNGVEYDDLIEYFQVEDFGVSPTIMIPNRLKQLSDHGYLRQVCRPGSSANAAYRLT